MAIFATRLATARSAIHRQVCPFLGRSLSCRSIPSAHQKRFGTSREPSAERKAGCPILNVTERSMQVPILYALFAGIISFLSPCVLPLVPGYVSMLSGIGIEQLRAGQSSDKKLLASSLAFVGG